MSKFQSRALIGVAVATLAVLLTASSALGFGTFVYSDFYVTGDSPYRLAAADLDKDGHPDIVVGNCGSAYASLLWNKGDGTFLAPRQLVLGSDTCPEGVAFGDFNKDGRTDVAISEFKTNQVAVFINKGHRAFKAAAKHNASPALGPVDLVVSDFNHDGFLDIAIDGYTSGSVALLRGQAGGNFEGASGQRAVGSKPIAMISGDFNKDGNVDLVTANSGGSTLSLLNGSRNGTFGTAATLTVGTGPSALAKGDFNRDGQLDISALNGTGHTISLLRGAGHGQFHAQRTFELGNVYPTGLAAGDFDGDHWPDLGVSETYGNAVAILSNNGSGSFVLPPATYYANISPTNVLAAKLNGDGALDLASTILGIGPGGDVDTGGVTVLFNHP